MYKKTYLITGGAGFIGTNFIKYLLDKYEDIKIICLDKLTYAGNFENLKQELKKHSDRFNFIKGDIRDKKLLGNIFRKGDINYVVNFAAESHVDRSIRKSNIFIKTNVMGVQNLLSISKQYWNKNPKNHKKDFRFLQISTDEVYGSLDEERFFNENDPLKPNSPYSASKASADLLVRSYNKTYKLPTLITRCSNNYGPYQFPEKLVPLMINNILKGKKLPIYGDGENIRDWLYVKDHCKAIDMVLNEGNLGEIYNIGGCNEKTNNNIVRILIREVKKFLENNKNFKNKLDVDINKINENLIEYVEDRLGHDKRYAINPEKIKKEVGWEPNVLFEDGIKKTIEWYLKHQDWLENITNGEYKKYYDKMYLNR